MSFTAAKLAVASSVSFLRVASSSCLLVWFTAQWKPSSKGIQCKFDFKSMWICISGCLSRNSLQLCRNNNKDQDSPQTALCQTYKTTY